MVPYVEGTQSLIALGVGYLVLIKADKEKKKLRTLGVIVGVLVMAGAVAGMFYVKCKMLGCGFGSAPMCPFTAKMHEMKK